MSRSTQNETIDRSACPGKPGAHHPKRIGNVWAYKWFDCRCPDASEARRIYEKRGREHRRTPAMVDPTGTRRRLQALAQLGYSPMRVGEGSAFHGKHLHQVRQGATTKVSQPIATYVTKFYANHENSPLPHDASTSQVRNTARKLDWAPPEAWDPDTIDNPNATPQHKTQDVGVESVNEEVELQLLLSGHAKHPAGFDTPAARRRWRNLLIQAVDILVDRGFIIPEIMDQLHLNERQVLRLKKVMKERRAPEPSEARGINDLHDHAGTTPSATTPREAHVA